MNYSAHITALQNSPKPLRIYPFVFTGKEKDPETGYSYFGSRYLEHDLMTGWLSVDPMADKYPSISPYAYCAWNPVKLIDPNGMTWETNEDKKKAEMIKEETTNRISDLEKYKASLEGKIKLGNMSERKMNALKYELSESDNQISLLSDFIKGIDELSGSDIRYTFNPTRSPINQVKTSASSGTLYKINYQSGNDGNQVHEMVHAIQVDRMEHNRIDKMSLIEMEQGAYSTQYSFSPSSMPLSHHKNDPSSRISADWVRQIYIYYNGEQMPYKDL